MGIEGKIVIGKLKGFPDSGKNLQTKALLDLARELLSLYDKFGTLFSPAEHDFRKNIEALAELYDEKNDAYIYLESFIVESSKINNNDSAVKLYWLLQHAEFAEAFLNNLINDEKNEYTSVKLFQMAYESSIRKNHGFIVREAIKLYLNLIPSKDVLFGTEEYFEENILHLKRLAPILTEAIEEVNCILEKVPYTL